MTDKHYFNIADHIVCIAFSEGLKDDGISLLPSFEPFRMQTCPKEKALFTICIEENVKRLETTGINIFTENNPENSTIIINKSNNGIYQFIINDANAQECCILLTDDKFTDAKCSLSGNRNMKSLGLNNALMIMYAFRGSFCDTLLIHASAIEKNGYGYAFVAKSGVGKSTHTQLWLRNIKDSILLNDDNPIIRLINNVAYIYGSPWSGKTPCYKQRKAKLGAITKIVRAKHNSIYRCLPYIAYGNVLSNCSNLKYDKIIANNISESIIKLIETMGNNFILECMPNNEAALICHKEISRA